MGESRRDPATGDTHHYDDAGTLIGISWQDAESGEVLYRAFGTPRPVYVPPPKPEPTWWDEARGGWILAVWVLILSAAVWSADLISGIEVLIYPLAAWGIMAMLAAMKKDSTLISVSLWFGPPVFLFLRGVAGAS